jgi:Tfp pilus assembly protein PilX
MKPMRHQQRGATLIVALILLVLLTLFAVTSFNLGKNSLQTVGNMQHRNEAISAAQQTEEEAISTTRLFQSPANVILGNPACKNGQPNTKCIDINGDGIADITVLLAPAPTCVKAQAILNSQLSASSANDIGCGIQTTQGFGIIGQATGNSLCADSLWEVTAVAQDNATGAQYSVTEGIGVRVSTDDIAASCP